MIDDFKGTNHDKTDEACYSLIGVRIPESYKTKYDDIQKMNNNKFSKLISDLVKKAIDSVGQ